MKIEFEYMGNCGFKHNCKFNFTTENNFQIIIDGEVIMQKLGE